MKEIDGDRGKEMSGFRNSRNPSDCSVLSYSDNKRVCGSLHSPKPLRASHTRGTSSEIADVEGVIYESVG
jgi:hypothetical protein